jgi:hypothetical protein
MINKILKNKKINREIWLILKNRYKFNMKKIYKFYLFKILYLILYFNILRKMIKLNIFTKKILKKDNFIILKNAVLNKFRFLINNLIINELNIKKVMKK